MDMKRFHGRTCVVTGGASGLGRASAERLAAEGGRMALLDLPASFEKHADDGTSSHLRVACDVTDRGQVEQAFATILEGLGSVDVLVNSAGIGHSQDFLELEDEAFARVMAVNVNGVFITSQVAARQMVDSGRGGSIVNVASVGGFLGGSTLAAYGASKGAVVAMTKSMAVALAQHGVRVNALAPGTIATDLLESGPENPEFIEGVRRRTPLERLGTAEEIAGAVSFLCSDDASYMTGDCIFVDGGRTALNHTVPAHD